MQETQFQSMSQEDPLEKGMATHSSILAWRIPWTEEPGRLQSVGSRRVRHDWATSFHCHFMVSKYIYMSLFPVFRGIAAVLWTFVWSFSPETLSFLLFQLGFWVLRCLFYDWSYNALAIRSLFNPDFLNADYFEIEILSEGLWFGRLKRLDLAWLCKILWNLHSTCLFEI